MSPDRSIQQAVSNKCWKYHFRVNVIGKNCLLALCFNDFQLPSVSTREFNTVEFSNLKICQGAPRAKPLSAVPACVQCAAAESISALSHQGAAWPLNIKSETFLSPSLKKCYVDRIP